MACGIEKESDKIIRDLQCECKDGTWRLINICKDCYDKFNTDIWIDEDEWNTINPLTSISEMEICYPF